MSDDAPKLGAKHTNPAWADIRARSVVDFVNKVSASLGNPRNRELRQMLYDAVFTNGDAQVRWHGATYTGEMLLDLYFRERREAVA